MNYDEQSIRDVIIINCDSQLKAISLKSRPFDSYCWIKIKGHVHSMEKALEIYQGTLSSIRQVLITAFNNISAVYEKMGDHSKTFEGLREVLSSNHPQSLAAFLQ